MHNGISTGFDGHPKSHHISKVRLPNDPHIDLCLSPISLGPMEGLHNYPVIF